MPQMHTKMHLIHLIYRPCGHPATIKQHSVHLYIVQYLNRFISLFIFTAVADILYQETTCWIVDIFSFKHMPPCHDRQTRY